MAFEREPENYGSACLLAFFWLKDIFLFFSDSALSLRFSHFLLLFFFLLRCLLFLFPLLLFAF
ncbi:hypothetical protein V8C40DRAFT_206208 [Trichoderma camerunense]